MKPTNGLAVVDGNGTPSLIVHAAIDEPIVAASLSVPLRIDPPLPPPGEPCTVEIPDMVTGKPVFRQRGCVFPAGFSETAKKVVGSKYFYGDVDHYELTFSQSTGHGDGPANGGREWSFYAVADRVAGAIAAAGVEQELLHSGQEAPFRQTLAALLLEQKLAFNSPVWFNVGLSESYGLIGSLGNYAFDAASGQVLPCTDTYASPQASACFIQSVRDDMQDIMRLAASEAMLFKHGSGTGTDLSTLRSSREKLTGGGRPSGPVSFFRLYDCTAGLIKSGGKTRRAARMNTLKVHHPDILEFIDCKSIEEDKARALIAAGYDAHMDGGAYATVAFQNTNTAIRVTDAFMRMVENGGDIQTRAVSPHCDAAMPSYNAEWLLRRAASANHNCGDPGLQYEDTIQRWHTCPNTAPINSSNPCSEYMFIDESACNLSSINILRFYDTKSREFDVLGFVDTCAVAITAKEILVDHASYPTASIAQNSHDFRPLGLGYANLGAWLMTMGLPYDSDAGRDAAAILTALMHCTAYAQSARMAGHLTPFARYAENRDPMMRVIRNHAEHAENLARRLLNDRNTPAAIREIAEEAQHQARAMVMLGEKHGFRNSQVTLLAPTGTIAFLMDCATTGIEPDLGLVKYKSLAGGGYLTIANDQVAPALEALGYGRDDVDSILAHVQKTGGVEGAERIRPEHLAVFDCANPAPGGTRFIRHEGHIKMMGAVQPFLSGAISKTVNLPAEATVDDFMACYMLGWKLGLKAVAIYRDGSKGGQPLSVKAEDVEDEEAVLLAPVAGGLGRGEAEKLPNEVESRRFGVRIDEHKIYLHVGFFPGPGPKRVGEIFIKSAKEGSTIAGLLDTIGAAISIGLQYGVPLETFVTKFIGQRFEPSGWTSDDDVRMAKSVIDWVFRKIDAVVARTNGVSVEVDDKPVYTLVGESSKLRSTGLFCSKCSSPLTRRTGACYTCDSCGTTTGACG